MKIYEYGDLAAEIVLIQPVDDHDLSVIDNEVRLIGEMTGVEFSLKAVKVDCWNDDLSPWQAPAVFGKDDFSGGAESTLDEIVKLCADTSTTYYIGGYSLAGLFALWAVYRSDRFRGAAAASPSVWFPGFTEYMATHDIRCGAVYLSLGDREERTKNPVMATVGDCIRADHVLLRERGIDTILEWNQGNHFRDPDLRTAKAFAWLINR